MSTVLAHSSSSSPEGIHTVHADPLQNLCQEMTRLFGEAIRGAFWPLEVAQQIGAALVAPSQLSPLKTASDGAETENADRQTCALSGLKEIERGLLPRHLSEPPFARGQVAAVVHDEH